MISFYHHYYYHNYACPLFYATIPIPPYLLLLLLLPLHSKINDLYPYYFYYNSIDSSLSYLQLLFILLHLIYWLPLLCPVLLHTSPAVQYLYILHLQPTLLLPPTYYHNYDYKYQYSSSPSISPPRHPIVKHRRPFLSYHRRQKKEEERKIQYLYILHLQSSTSTYLTCSPPYSYHLPTTTTPRHPPSTTDPTPRHPRL